MNQTSTVLIVDDQEMMRDTLDGMLCNQGYQLAFAADGQEALNLATQLLPDVVLLDVMMPGMNGFEVCEHLRADPLLAKVPVIMVTALNDQDSRLRAIEAGADDFISKPYNMVELRARVRNITDLNRYQRLNIEQQKFKWMFENTDEAYLLLNNGYQITYINAKARLYLNLSTDASITENFITLIAKYYYQVHEPSHNLTPIDTNQLELPNYIVRSDTETALPFWLRVNTMEMVGESAKEKYLVHLSNVTDAIIAKRQNWTFGGQINHKFKTPLIPVLTGSEFLLRNQHNLTPEKLKRFLEMIHAGATRIYTQIDKILSYTELSNKGESTLEPCIITNLLASINITKELLEIKSLFISQPNNIKNSLRLPISCAGMEVILTELFSNAKKFHPTGTPIIEIAIKIKSNSLCLQICDDGIQLSPEQLVNMWIPYYQGEKYFTGEAEGMGLGLSMVGTLIWEVGGSCQAYNRIESKGVVVELTLPLK